MKLPSDFFYTDPYQFQIEPIKYGIENTNAGILYDMGLGKTYIAINIARYRLQNNNVKRVLVVCPPSILLNWGDKIRKFSEYDYVILNDTKDNRKHKILYSGAEFHIINYESLFPILRDLGVMWKDKYFNRKLGRKATKIVLSAKYKELIKSLGYNMIIFDETAKFVKNHTTDRAVASTVVSDEAKYHLILTGNIIEHKPLDVWSQFRILDGGKMFGTNFYRHRKTFFNERKVRYWKEWIIKPELISVMQDCIYQICIRKTKEECLPYLPKQIFDTIEIEMPRKMAKDYNNLKISIKNEILKTVESDKKVRILGILAKLTRLQQFTAGFVNDIKKGFIPLNHRPKLDALIENLELVVEAEESAIVWCRFKMSLKMISEELQKRDISHIIFSGDDNAKEKFKKWRKFQTSGVSVFIGQVESGSVGIELFKEDSDDSKSQYTFFYENPWTLGTRLQATDRQHRIGQRSLCVIKDIVVKDTIDIQILDSIKKNKEVADLITEKGVDIIL